MLILIVDDDPDDREIFCEAVKAIDPKCTCLQAKDGEEGLVLLTEKLVVLPDFVFLDINMPRITGWECLIEIRKDERLKDLTIIIYSTNSSPVDADKCFSLGAAFLPKQSEYRTLIQRLSEILMPDGGRDAVHR